MSSTDAEDADKVPSEGSKDGDKEEEERKLEEERQLQIRLRHLKRRMVRAEQEAQELQRRVDAIKAKINKPIEPPRICPTTRPPQPPQPLKRRRRMMGSAAGGDEDWMMENTVSEMGGAGDATINARR